MLQKAELIYRKADDLVQRCGTRDTLRIADKIGIYTHYLDSLQELLGLYSYRHKERHVLLNSNMDYIATQMVCGHEIGHDTLHRDQAKGGITLQEFTLFDMRNEMEYEADVQQRAAAKEFAADWQEKGYEKGHSQTFCHSIRAAGKKVPSFP